MEICPAPLVVEGLKGCNVEYNDYRTTSVLLLKSDQLSSGHSSELI